MGGGVENARMRVRRVGVDACGDGDLAGGEGGEEGTGSIPSKAAAVLSPAFGFLTSGARNSGEEGRIGRLCSFFEN